MKPLIVNKKNIRYNIQVSFFYYSNTIKKVVIE